MLRFPVFVLAFLVCLSLAACDSVSEEPLDHAEVRLVNETGFDLDSVRVTFSVIPDEGRPEHEQVLRFGPLSHGEGTEYRALDGTHVYNYTIAFASGLYGLPIMSMLSPMFRENGPVLPVLVGSGRYTYRLQLEPYPATLLEVMSPDRSQPDAPADQVEVRVENLGEQAFEAVAVTFPSGPSHSGATRVEYGSVPAGATSEYVPIAFSYRYAPAEVVVEGDTVRWKAIDYVGEAPLEPGKYTFGLLVWETTGYRDRTTLEREGDH